MSAGAAFLSTGPAFVGCFLDVRVGTSGRGAEAEFLGERGESMTLGDTIPDVGDGPVGAYEVEVQGKEVHRCTV